jgi:hypothetical protein
VWGEVAALSHTLGSLMLTFGAPSLSTWCALLHWKLLYIEALFPFCNLVGALGRITCVIIVIVLSFYIGIKKGFGGKLGVDLMCGCSLSCTNFEVKLF